MGTYGLLADIKLIWKSRVWLLGMLFVERWAMLGVANNARSKLQIVTQKSFVRDLRVLFECDLEGFRPPRRVCDLQARRKDKPTPIPSTIFYLDRNNQKLLTLHSYSMKPHLSRPRTSLVEEDNPYQQARVSTSSNAQIAIADQDRHLLQLSDATRERTRLRTYLPRSKNHNLPCPSASITSSRLGPSSLE